MSARISAHSYLRSTVPVSKPKPRGGDSHMKLTGMLVGKLALKETNLGVAQALFEP